MIWSRALLETTIALYCTRSRVLSLAASCRVTRFRLRAARWASEVNGASTMSTLPFGAMRPMTRPMALVLASLLAKASMTETSPAVARSKRARLKARALTLPLIFLEKSRGFGPKTTPPPLHSGERMEPARARPVPFWAHGFLPPPDTSPRVLVERVPWRALARWATTTSLTACRPREPSKVGKLNSFSELLLASDVKSLSFMDYVLRWS